MPCPIGRRNILCFRSHQMRLIERYLFRQIT